MDAARDIRIADVGESLPTSLPSLAAQARSEGFRHLDRLLADWESGALRFDRPGEVLLAAHCGPDLAGIGGLTVEEELRNALRMRRLYVARSCRNRGIGRRLVESLLRQAPDGTVAITLNAGNPDAEAFWEKLGFTRHSGDGFTHLRHCGIANCSGTDRAKR